MALMPLIIVACEAEEDVQLDRSPSEVEVNYSPENEVIATNPPAFTWLPIEGVERYIVQFSQDSSFEDDQTTTVRNLDMSVHIPATTLDEGIWFWRYGYNDDGEDRFSKIREFVIPETATEFPLVTAEEFISNIPEHRPRLYYSPDLVEEIRNDDKGRYSHITQPVIEEAEEILEINEPLFEEPDPWTEEDYLERYNETWRAMIPYTHRMVTSALAYLYTGDERFAEEAKRRLMHFMTWDVDGPSSAIWPTELGMNIAENATPVFDWIYDTLTEEERQKCEEILTKRMVQINQDVHRDRPMESRPFVSHAGRMVGFVIEGGIVLAHEAPEARDWLDYTLRLLWSTYPAWDGDEGGWHEGISYWSSYMRRMVLMTDQEPANYHGDKPERSSIEDVYDLIISDFTEAIEKLPSSWGADKPARPTSGAARGLLANVYLTMATAPINDESYYQNAKDEAQAVMDSGVYHLVEDINDVFSFATEFGPEMMFSHVQNSQRSGTPSGSNYRPGLVDRAWFEKFPDQPRKDAYLLFEQIDTGEPIDLSQTTPGIGKYLYMDEEDLRSFRDFSNWPIIRYADVLLIFAEAENRVNGGPTAAAVEAVNKIIDRANGYEENPEHPRVDTGMSMAEFEERVLLERDLELSFEYTRWFDIIRHRLYPEAITREEDIPNWQDHMYLLPIPDQDLRTNENLTQNTGYRLPAGVEN